MRTLIKILVTTITFSFPLMLSANTDGLYRWVDDKGVVKYSDHPPVGVEAEFIKFANTGSSKATTPAENMTEDSAEPSAPLSGKMEVLPAKDPALCTQAQGNLKALEGARIRITEPDGSQRFLTEEEKEDQRENARKFIAINC